MAKKSIIVIDDQVESLKIIDSALGEEYEIIAAKTTTKAFAMLHNENFDLILLDYMMPGMTGLEFLDYVQKQAYYRKTPVVFISSESDRDVVNKAVLLGARGYIKKPIDPVKLREKVKEELG